MNRNFCGLGSLALLLVAPAFADDCASLETALNAAPQQMRSLKQGRYDPSSATAFNTSWRWGTAGPDDCMVSYDEDDGYDLACMLESSSISEAKEIAEEIMSTVQGCLTDSGRRFRVTPVALRTTRFGDWHTGEVLVQYNDTNDIEVRVSASCRTNRRGLERCSTHITIELIGDEKA